MEAEELYAYVRKIERAKKTVQQHVRGWQFWELAQRGLTLREIADDYGMKPGSVRIEIAKARQRRNLYLTRRGAEKLREAVS